MKRCILPLLFLAAAAAWAGPPTVLVREASVYSDPSVTSRFLGKLSYGTVLTVLGTQTGWSRVSGGEPGLTGWVRNQTFTTKDLNLKTGSQTSGASAAEVSLAGRGFSEEVEQKYRDQNPALDFGAVDLMETGGLGEGALLAFLAEGGLNPDGGRP